jgi:exonuclease III
VQETKIGNYNMPQWDGYSCISAINHKAPGQAGVSIYSKLLLNIEPFPILNDYINDGRISAGISLPLKLIVLSIYVPHGRDSGHEQVVYKISFIKSIFQCMRQLNKEYTDFGIIFGGDWNLVGRDIDHTINNWVISSGLIKRLYRVFPSVGFHEIYVPDGNVNTGFDYRTGKNFLIKNLGYRIDWCLSNKNIIASSKSQALYQYRHYNYKKWRCPSDHAPISYKIKILL